MMYPLGTRKGVQDAAAAEIMAVPMSQPFPNGFGTGPNENRFSGAALNPLAHPALPREGERKDVCAAPAPRTGDVPFAGSQHRQYLPFLFQTARVEVGRLVKED